MSFDRAFLSADAVTAEDGICEADHSRTRFKELTTRRGNNVYVLADSSKLGLRPFHAWARLELHWTLVTKFREAGVAVEVAAVASEAGAS